jgi:glycosyltransferase involved in cell wall biosynthesis
VPPTLALCIPAYNAAAFLPRLFESVKAQTMPFDEVLVYDDCSSDDTAAVASRFGARVVRGERNLGCSAGKNALLAITRCEWIHFHDADDTVNPEFVERAKARIASGGCDVILFDYEQVDEQSGAVNSRTSFAGSRLFTDAVGHLLRETMNNGGVHCTEFLRKVGGFDTDPAVLYNEDRAFHLRLAESGARFGYEPYVGSRFFFRANSMSASNRVRCSLSNQEITRRWAERHPGDHARDVGFVSWKNAGVLASFLEWQAADECVQLAIRCTGRIPSEGGLLFRALCVVSGRWAIRVRERLIRRFKPRYRLGYPQPSNTLS